MTPWTRPAARSAAGAALALSLSLLLAACGGQGEGSTDGRTTSLAQARVDTPAGGPTADGTARRQALAAAHDAGPVRADELFNWAQGQFPAFFPGQPPSGDFDVYRYRFYPETGTYLGIDLERRVWVLGPLSGGQLLNVGTVEGFACEVKLADCRAPSFTTLPQAATVAAGTVVNLSAVVAGGPSLRYQWSLGGQPVAGATAASVSVTASTAVAGQDIVLTVANARGTVSSPPVRISLAQPAADGRTVAQRQNCLACHTVDKRLVGPAFRDIATRYAGRSDALALLTQKVRKGGSGVWGAIPMPANASISDADLATVLNWVLAGAP